jgi:hypothetical protein
MPVPLSDPLRYQVDTRKAKDPPFRKGGAPAKARAKKEKADSSSLTLLGMKAPGFWRDDRGIGLQCAIEEGFFVAAEERSSE